MSGFINKELIFPIQVEKTILVQNIGLVVAMSEEQNGWD